MADLIELGFTFNTGAADSKIGALVKKFEELKREAEEADSASKVLAANIKNAASPMGELKKNSGDAAGKLETFRQSVVKLNQNLETSERRFSAAGKAIEFMNSMMNQSVKASNGANASLERLFLKAEGGGGRIKVAKDAFAEMVATLDSGTTTLKNTKDSLADVNAGFTKHAEGIRAVRDAAGTLNTKLKETGARLKDSKNNLQDFNSGLKKNADRLKSAESTFSAINKKFELSAKTLSVAKESVNSFNTALSTGGEHLRNANSAIKSLNDRMEKTGSKVRDAREALKSLNRTAGKSATALNSSGDSVRKFGERLRDVSKIKIAGISDTVRNSFQECAQNAKTLGIALEKTGRSRVRMPTDKVREFGNHVAGVQTRILATGTILHQAFYGSMAVMFLKSAASAAAKLGEELAYINTLERSFNTGRIRSGVLNMSSIYGKASDITKAYYTAVSSGVRSSEESTMHFVHTASKTAALIRSDVPTAVDAMTAAMNAYGFSAREAARVGDVLFKIVDYGKANGQQLANSFGQITATAVSAGVEIEELGASIATLTKVMPTRNAVTFLNNALAKMIRPTKISRDAAAELGVELGVSTVKAKGFGNVMRELFEAGRSNPEALLRLFPDLRGQRAMLQLLGEGWSDYTNAMNEFKNSAGAVDKSIKVLDDDIYYQINRIPVTIDKIRIAAGELMIKIGTLGGTLNPVINAFNSMGECAQQIAGGIGLAVAGLSAYRVVMLAVHAIQAAEIRNNAVISRQRAKEISERKAIIAAVSAETAAYQRNAAAKRAESGAAGGAGANVPWRNYAGGTTGAEYSATAVKLKNASDQVYNARTRLTAAENAYRQAANASLVASLKAIEQSKASGAASASAAAAEAKRAKAVLDRAEAEASAMRAAFANAKATERRVAGAAMASAATAPVYGMNANARTLVQQRSILAGLYAEKAVSASNAYDAAKAEYEYAKSLKDVSAQSAAYRKMMAIQNAMIAANTRAELMNMKVLQAKKAEMLQHIALQKQMNRQRMFDTFMGQGNLRQRIRGGKGFTGGFGIGGLEALRAWKITGNPVKQISSTGNAVRAIGTGLGRLSATILKVLSPVNIAIGGAIGVVIGLIDYMQAGWDVNKTVIVKKAGEGLYNFFTGAIDEANRVSEHLEERLQTVIGNKKKMRGIASWQESFLKDVVNAASETRKKDDSPRTLAKVYAKSILDTNAIIDGEFKKAVAGVNRYKEFLKEDNASEFNRGFDFSAAAKRANKKYFSNLDESGANPNAGGLNKTTYWLAQVDKFTPGISLSKLSNWSYTKAADSVQAEYDEWRRRQKEWLEKSAKETGKGESATSAMEKAGQKILEKIRGTINIAKQMIAGFELLQDTFNQFKAKRMTKAELIVKHSNDYRRGMDELFKLAGDSQKNGALMAEKAKNATESYRKAMKYIEENLTKISELGITFVRDRYENSLTKFDVTGDIEGRMSAMGARASELARIGKYEFNPEGLKKYLGGMSLDEITKFYGEMKESLKIDTDIRKIRVKRANDLADAERRANDGTLKLIRSMDKFKATALDAVDANSADALKLQSRTFEKLPDYRPMMQSQKTADAEKSGLVEGYQRNDEVIKVFQDVLESVRVANESQKANLESQKQKDIDAYERIKTELKEAQEGYVKQVDAFAEKVRDIMGILPDKLEAIRRNTENLKVLANPVKF